MGKKSSCIATVLLSLALSACTPSEPTYDPTADRAAIEAGSATWNASFNEGDVLTLGQVYSGDAILYPPNSPPIKGRQAIQEFLQQLLASGVKGEMTREETEAHGEVGHNIGSFILTAPDGSVADEGHFVELWVKRDGAWRLHRDIFNSDLPSSPAASPAGDDPS